MDKSTLTVTDVERMSYTDFIALLRETNRCPGGKKTIRRIRELLHIDSQTKILDVGSNTGFTSLELARITPARVWGIDVSEPCVAEAKRLLSEDVTDVQSRVNFQVGSAYDIPFPDNEFDLMMVGGATSFMDDKNKAINEYLRVLKPWGFLVSSPLTYHTEPPQKVIDDVSAEIGVRIEPLKGNDWIQTVRNTTQDFEVYLAESHPLSPRTLEDIENYVDYFINKEHIHPLPTEVKAMIRKKWSRILNIFNENHKYLGYDMVIFRKREIFEEPELFI